MSLEQLFTWARSELLTSIINGRRCLGCLCKLSVNDKENLKPSLNGKGMCSTCYGGKPQRETRVEVLDEVILEEREEERKEEQFYARSTLMAGRSLKGQEGTKMSTKSKQVQVRASVSAQMQLRESLQIPN